jgi:DNA-binding transcriptional LysR family regulator
MNLDDVVVFVTVDEHSSFSAAARKLGLSRVGVSRSISRLEASVGTKLLMRTSRHVWLTSAGREFRDRVKEPITSLNGAVREFSGRDLEPTGRIRVGAMPEVAAMGLAPTIARFAEENPAVRLELQQTSALDGVAAGAFDVVLGFPGEVERLELRASTSRYVGAAVCQLFAAPSYLEKHGIPQGLGDLVRHTLVSASVGAFEKTSAVNLLRAAGSSHGIACMDMFLAREFIRLGCGLGLLPGSFAQRDVETGALVPVLAEWNEARLDLWLLLSPGPPLTSLPTAFCEFLISDLRRREVVVV